MNDINKALEDLRKSLQQVDSARKQSQDTIQAYTDLQGKITEYISQFKGISEELDKINKFLYKESQSVDEQGKNVLKSLSSECSELISDLQKKLLKETSGFQSACNKEVLKIEDANKTLEKKISELSALKSDIQKSVVAINDFSEKFESWKTDNSSEMTTITSTLDSIKSHLNTLATGDGVDTIKTKLDSIKSLLDSMGTSNNANFKSLSSEIKQVAEKNTGGFKELEKQNKWNKILLFAVLAASVLSFVVILLK